MSSSNNSFMDRRQMNGHYYAKQIDSSELIQEIQLSLMYLIRMIFSAIQSSIKHFVKRIIHRLNELYINSALNILVFKLRTCKFYKKDKIFFRIKNNTYHITRFIDQTKSTKWINGMATKTIIITIV